MKKRLHDLVAALSPGPVRRWARMRRLRGRREHEANVGFAETIARRIVSEEFAKRDRDSVPVVAGDVPELRATLVRALNLLQRVVADRDADREEVEQLIEKLSQ